ncbi:MAG: hypothetical protein KBE07_06810, partial [Rhodoferax sp.]|nr:hypothetical protein [Rhodoferax sp.]
MSSWGRQAANELVVWEHPLGSDTGHTSPSSNLSLDLPCRTRIAPERRQLCQNIDIHLTKSINSQSEAASHFQEDLMANIWSIVQLLEHFSVLYTIR